MSECISICITVVLVVGIVIGGSMWGCAEHNSQYQTTVRACITSGGQWVPQWGNDGSCIKPGRT